MTIKSSVFILASSFGDNDELRFGNTLEAAENKSCSLIDDSCCCGPNAHKKSDCCCKSQTLGKDSRPLAIGTPNSNLFAVFISSIKCSDIPGDLQTVSLNDYQLTSPDNFSTLFEEAGFLTYLQENLIIEPHLLLPYKPPKNIS